MPPPGGAVRIERDSLGTVEVPGDRLWGAQTERARRHFAIGHEAMPLEVIHAYGLLKGAAAAVNAELGALDPVRARWIQAAAAEVAAGTLDDHFPLRIWQSGSGTQTNMNVNEVLARRATELAGTAGADCPPIHPNDHVNRSQSTNDTFPAVMHLATVQAWAVHLLPAVATLEQQLTAKAEAFAALIKIGRTHLQDAVPMTLGQEFRAFAAQLQQARAALEAARDPLCELPLGATAVGTGLNAPPEFGPRTCARLAETTGLAFRPASNPFAALAAHDALAQASATLRTLAGALIKVANDLRWLGSGPRCGLGELRLPENEPGSSIMPGKVNPTQCEAVLMVAAQVYGLDAAVAQAAALGNFQLNVYKPLIIYNVLTATRLLGDACRSFGEHLVRGVEANQERLKQNVEECLMMVTALTGVLGYDRAAKVAQKAHREGLSLRAACLALGWLDAATFDATVQPAKLVGAG
ncbi:MAG: class II fumarate hydratase [Candidatus Marinimicrobia bacterium]|nr:class II fumarate hydratase [Candidatus Neomarinimicrobiota bacterium]